jgi:hypothetical protein
LKNKPILDGLQIALLFVEKQQENVMPENANQKSDPNNWHKDPSTNCRIE